MVTMTNTTLAAPDATRIDRAIARLIELYVVTAGAPLRCYKPHHLELAVDGPGRVLELDGIQLRMAPMSWDYPEWTWTYQLHRDGQSLGLTIENWQLTPKQSLLNLHGRKPELVETFADLVELHGFLAVLREAKERYAATVSYAIMPYVKLD